MSLFLHPEILAGEYKTTQERYQAVSLRFCSRGAPHGCSLLLASNEMRSCTVKEPLSSPVTLLKLCSLYPMVFKVPVSAPSSPSSLSLQSMDFILCIKHLKTVRHLTEEETEVTLVKKRKGDVSLATRSTNSLGYVNIKEKL